jgi:hypothetical protein
MTTKKNKSESTKESDMTIDTSKTEPSADAKEKTIRAEGKKRTGGHTPVKNYTRSPITELKTNPCKFIEHKVCHIPEKRPSKIERYHVEQLILSLAVASNWETKDVRRQVYRIFHKRAMAKGFNIFVEAKKQEIAIIEAIRRRGLMDKLYDIVIRCMAEYNKAIREETENDVSIPPKSGSFTGME